MDADLFRAVNRLAEHTSWLHGAMTFYAGVLGPALLAGLVLLAVWRCRSRDARSLALAGWAGLAPLLAVVLNQPLVHAVHRARPWQALDDVLVLAHHSADPSFPSDHAVLAGAVLTSLLLLDRRLGAVAAAAGVLLGFSRVYVGAHYPGDVAAGLLVGSGIAVLGWLALHRPLTWLVERVRHTALAPLLVSRTGGA